MFFTLQILRQFKEEIHNQEEYDNALKNLAKVNFKVDYVVTHTVPKRFLENVDFNAANCTSMGTSADPVFLGCVFLT